MSLILVLVLLAAGAAQTAEPGTPQVSFVGRVFDGRGDPVPDANVALYEVSYSETDVSSRVKQVQETTTGPDGVFTLSANKDAPVYRQGSIIVHKPGLALGWAIWEMSEGNRQSDITLGAPGELAGIVVDEGDSPIVDAEVGIALGVMGDEKDRRHVTYFVAPQLLTVRTDSMGRFVFPNMPGGATFELLARKSGRATTSTFDPSIYRGEKGQFSTGQTGIKLTLPGEARIEGKVVEKTSGKPLGGLMIVAQPDRRGFSFGAEPVASAQDGAFFLGNLAAGAYLVQSVSPAEGATEWIAEPVKVDLKAGETVRGVRLALVKGGVLEVIVTEEGGGKPIERAGIDVRSVGGEQRFSGRTDAAGVARILLAPGDYEIRSTYKKGYIDPEQSQAFTIVEGQTKRLEQTLGSLPWVSGVVYDEAGKPVGGASVRVVPGSGGDGVVSDAQGKFKIRWDPQGWSQPGMAFYLIARHPQRNLATAQPVQIAGSGVEVRLRPGVTIAGQVVDPDGKAIAGASIQIMLRTEWWGATFMASRSIRTDAQGRYEVPAVPTGQRYNINASADGYGQAEVNLEAEEVKGDRVPERRSTLAVANLSVSGVVVDSAGKPVPNAHVSCSGDAGTGQPGRDARADAQGRFTLTGICSGRVRIQASAEIAGIQSNGVVETDGGAADLRIAVTGQNPALRSEPRRTALLVGRRLPDLKKLGIELPVDANDRMLLVCFWDMNQRPSRYCMSELMRRAARFAEQGVTIVAVHAGPVEEGALAQWIEKTKSPFPISRITGDFENTQFQWGAAALPHLILTDSRHIVIAEGFGLLEELDKRIEQVSDR